MIRQDKVAIEHSSLRRLLLIRRVPACTDEGSPPNGRKTGHNR